MVAFPPLVPFVRGSQRPSGRQARPGIIIIIINFIIITTINISSSLLISGSKSCKLILTYKLILSACLHITMCSYINFRHNQLHPPLAAFISALWLSSYHQPSVWFIITPVTFLWPYAVYLWKCAVQLLANEDKKFKSVFILCGLFPLCVLWLVTE